MIDDILFWNFFLLGKMLNILSHFILAVMFVLVTIKLSGCDETLQILHISRFHSRFEAEKDMSGKPVGGIARIIQYVENKKEDYGNSVLFFDTMDWFVGTVWYSVHRMEICKAFMNILPVDALGLGHSEMYEGHTNEEREKNFKSYLKSICNKTILCANCIIQDSGVSNCVKRSTVLQTKRLKVGVTAFIQVSITVAAFRTVKFTNELDAINQEARKLKDDGNDIVIVIAHSSYDFIRNFIGSVQNVDVIVLGHSNKLLFNGKPPVGIAIEKYPLQLTNADGNVTLVVTTGGPDYVGKLLLTVSSEGIVQADPTSNPEYMHSDILENKRVLELLEHFREGVEEKVSKFIGKSTALLNASCVLHECNMGNLVADAFTELRATSYETYGYWTDAPIAFLNAGNFRRDIAPQYIHGNVISFADLIAALPYNNMIHVFKINGSFLREALEHSVEVLVIDEATRFLQVSGLRVTYDFKKPPLERIVSVKARCAECDIPAYEELEDSKNYGVVTSSYIARGGDGYKFYQIQGQVTLAGTDLDAVLQYLENKLVYPGQEERIKILAYEKRRTLSKSTRNKELPELLHLIYIYNFFLIYF